MKVGEREYFKLLCYYNIDYEELLNTFQFFISVFDLKYIFQMSNYEYEAFFSLCFSRLGSVVIK